MENNQLEENQQMYVPYTLLNSERWKLIQDNVPRDRVIWITDRIYFTKACFVSSLNKLVYDDNFVNGRKVFYENYEFIPQYWSELNE